MLFYVRSLYRGNEGGTAEIDAAACSSLGRILFAYRSFDKIINIYI